MNKRLIRLTESDLHNIVKESVNKVLTELDWKTYMNAADKSYERGPMFQTYADPNEAPKRNERPVFIIVIVFPAAKIQKITQDAKKQLGMSNEE